MRFGVLLSYKLQSQARALLQFEAAMGDLDYYLPGNTASRHRHPIAGLGVSSMEGEAGHPGQFKVPQDRHWGNVNQPGDPTNGIALDHQVEDLAALFKGRIFIG